MHKCLLNVLAVFCLCSLVGCQSNQGSPNILSPLAPLVTPSSSLDQKVQEAFMRNEDPVIARVHVQAQQDVVILSGYVKKIRQSDVAEQIARQVPGVRVVENNIIIRP